MKITVDRIVDTEGELVFTIKVSEPHLSTLTAEELAALIGIDIYTKTIETTVNPTGVLYQDIVSANHQVKEKVFKRILDNLRFAIENQLQPKFQPICQEIYNWIYDKQEGFLKTWMLEFDPQRTTYFFDNDGRFNHPINHTPDDKLDDDDDMDDDDE